MFLKPIYTISSFLLIFFCSQSFANSCEDQFKEPKINLHLAIKINDIKRVQQLLNEGQKPTLHHFNMASSANQLEIFKLLVEVGGLHVDSHSMRMGGDTALMEASRYNYKDMFDYLLEKKADVNIENVYKQTALTEAVRNRHTEVIKKLIDHGANVNQITESGDSVLMLAVQTENKKNVKLLIDHGADVNAVSVIRNYTALDLVVWHNNKEILQLLIDNGADLNQQNIHGATPLIVAILKEADIKIVELLLKKGADPNLGTNYYGKTALVLAREQKNRNLMQLLLAYKAKEITYGSPPNLGDHPGGDREHLRQDMERVNKLRRAEK